MVASLLQKTRKSAGLILFLIAGIAAAQDALPPAEVLISVADQRLVVLRDGGLVAKYRISTSKFGVGDAFGSYKTPIGKLRVCNKIGDDLPPGAVIKHREATGEVLAVNAPGRDPIVTRVIWLEGLEDENRNARTRGIYIHGTPEESTLGKPVSWGCIRMRSRDVIELYDEIPPGTPVTISPERLPHLHKYKPAPPPPPPVIIASNSPAPVFPAKPTPAPETPASPMPTPEPPHPVVIQAASQNTGSISNVGEPESSEKPKRSSDPGAWHALKGSILFAGLPGTPTDPDSSEATTKTKAQP